MCIIYNTIKIVYIKIHANYVVVLFIIKIYYTILYTYNNQLYICYIILNINIIYIHYKYNAYASQISNCMICMTLLYRVHISLHYFSAPTTSLWCILWLYKSSASTFLMTQKRQKRQCRSYFCLWTSLASGKTISSVSSFLTTQLFTSHCAECGLFPTVSCYAMLLIN